MDALHVEGTIATIGHVGDSRLNRLDPKWNFYRETQDHSVVEEEVRAGRMTQEQAAHHPSRNVISRALGAEHSVEVDMKTIMIEPNTTFLLCSDGVTRHIDDFQLRELLLFKDTPENICGRIKEICYERGAEDNLTAVIARVTDKASESSVGEPTEKPAQYEEATAAAARPQSDGEATGGQFFIEETPTQPLTMPVTNNAGATGSINSDIQSAVANRIEESNAATNALIVQEPAGDAKIYRAENGSSSGKLSRLLSSILLLIVGGILGAGIYYLFSQNNRQPEIPQLAQQSPNIEFSSFETLRRSVDNDPNSFINRNANITQDAEGLYLLGRAYLLTEKYPEAKKSFEDARNKLAQVGLVNGKVLTNDIALGMAIIDEAAAQEKFQNQTNPNAENSNLQTNSKVNAR
jgi:protein phosphatase